MKGGIFVTKRMKYDRAEKKPKHETRINSGLFETHLELFDNCLFCAEGILGVLDYSDSFLAFRLKKVNLLIYGSFLKIISYENDTITVNGKIEQLEFIVPEEKYD